MLFTADSMLGRLAKYLRLCGLDTTYFSDIADSDLIDHAKNTGRVILTRDTLLMSRREISRGLIDAVLLRDNDIFGQLAQCRDEFPRRGLVFPPPRLFSRCVYCNTPLLESEKSAVFGYVPTYVYKTSYNFWSCPKCQRFFWQGTQQANFFKIIEELRRAKA